VLGALTLPVARTPLASLNLLGTVTCLGAVTSLGVPTLPGTFTCLGAVASPGPPTPLGVLARRRSPRITWKVLSPMPTVMAVPPAN
jgi:hypothetical protein